MTSSLFERLTRALRSAGAMATLSLPMIGLLTGRTSASQFVDDLCERGFNGGVPQVAASLLPFIAGRDAMSCAKLSAHIFSSCCYPSLSQHFDPTIEKFLSEQSFEAMQRVSPQNAVALCFLSYQVTHGSKKRVFDLLMSAMPHAITSCKSTAVNIALSASNFVETPQQAEQLTALALPHMKDFAEVEPAKAASLLMRMHKILPDSANKDDSLKAFVVEAGLLLFPLLFVHGNADNASALYLSLLQHQPENLRVQTLASEMLSDRAALSGSNKSPFYWPTYHLHEMAVLLAKHNGSDLEKAPFIRTAFAVIASPTPTVKSSIVLYFMPDSKPIVSVAVRTPYQDYFHDKTHTLVEVADYDRMVRVPHDKAHLEGLDYFGFDVRPVPETPDLKRYSEMRLKTGAQLKI